ncbi:MAG: hypothetical protein HOP09_14730 [Hyphomicrobium sp.]|nr:hypothetical protein [Hyphomicrobium sp.]
MNKNTILSAVPYDLIVDLARSLLAAGLTEEAAAKEIADFLDATVDFKTLIKGVVGQAAEAVDGAVFYAIALAVAKFAVAKSPKA